MKVLLDIMSVPFLAVGFLTRVLGTIIGYITHSFVKGCIVGFFHAERSEIERASK